MGIWDSNADFLGGDVDAISEGSFAPADIGYGYGDIGAPEGWSADDFGGGGGGFWNTAQNIHQQGQDLGIFAETIPGQLASTATSGALYAAGAPFGPAGLAAAWLAGKAGDWLGGGSLEDQARRDEATAMDKFAAQDYPYQTPFKEMVPRDDTSPYLPPLAQAPQSSLAQLPVPTSPAFDPYPTKQFTGLPNLAGYGRTGGAHPFFSPVTAQRGGLMDLRNQASNLAAQGRGGDSMLVHMRPDEVAGLQALGGVSRNPNTGLPENFLGSALGSLAGLALMPFTGGAINPFVMQALGAGGGEFLEGKMRGQSTQQALERGLMSGAVAGLGGWGMSKLGSAATAAPQPGMLAGAEAYTPGGLSAANLPSGSQYEAFGTYSPDVYEAITPEMWMGAGGLGGLGGYLQEPIPEMPEEEEDYYADMSPRYRRRARDIRDINLKDYGFRPEGRFFSTQYFDKGGMAQEGGIVEAGEMMEEAGPEGDVVAEEVTAQAVSAVRGDHPQPEEAISTYVEMFGEEQFGRLRELVVEQMQIGQLGGEEEIETEGMVSGPGAGRDDLIRGTIEGEQELRVSDGEFIVPADVVSGIGDGSSDAGAKRLHAMIDNIRKTRTGTDEQPARIDEARILPT